MWRVEPGARTYHVLDRGRRLELYPLFDSADRGRHKRYGATSYSAAVIDVARSAKGATALSGTRTYIAAHGSTFETIREPLTLHCHGTHLSLTH